MKIDEITKGEQKNLISALQEVQNRLILKVLEDNNRPQDIERDPRHKRVVGIGFLIDDILDAKRNSVEIRGDKYTVYFPWPETDLTGVPQRLVSIAETYFADSPTTEGVLIAGHKKLLALSDYVGTYLTERHKIECPYGRLNIKRADWPETFIIRSN